MRAVQDLSSKGVAIASGATALALPPPVYGLVSWTVGGQVIPEFDLEIWTDTAAIAVTAAKLYGAALHPLSYASIHPTLAAAVKASLDLGTKTTNCSTVVQAKVAGLAGDSVTLAFVQSSGAPNIGALTNVGSAYTFTFKTAVTTVANFETAIAASTGLEVKTPGAAHALATTADEFVAAPLVTGADHLFTKATHVLLTGDGPFELTAATTEPTGLDALQQVWVIKVNANTFQLAASLTDAMSGLPILGVTDSGTGQLTLAADATAQRVHWHSHGLLGDESDGAIALTNQVGYVVRRSHNARTFAYALVATLDTGSVSASIYPVRDVE